MSPISFNQNMNFLVFFYEFLLSVCLHIEKNAKMLKYEINTKWTILELKIFETLIWTIGLEFAHWIC